MTIFLVAAVIMFAVAFAFILPPLFRKNITEGNKSVEEPLIQNQANLAIGRERLLDLKNDLAAERIDQAQFDHARAELEQNLAQGLVQEVSTEQNSASKERSHYWLIIALVICLPMMAMGVYLKTSTPLALNPESQKAQQMADDQSLDIEAMVATLAERLESDPSSGEGWAMLGRSYVVMNRFSEAKEAFANAHKILGDDVPLLADYADAIGRSNNSNLTGDAKPLIHRALELDPEYSKIRWLAGMLAFQEQEFEKVPEFLQPILARTEPGSEIHESLKRLIEEAQSQSGVATVLEDVDQPIVSIKVRVSLAEKFADQVKPDDIVFIFAKAVQGPAMPLAVSRIKVSELPVTVTLDDSMAMRPNLRISSQQRVNISARVSRSGNAIAASGDLQAEVVEVKTETIELIEISIDRQLP